MLADGLKVYYEKRSENATVPKYAHNTDACCDLYSAEEVTIDRFSRKLIDTGIGIEMPEGFEFQIRPRSGMAWKHGITVINTPGTIDEGYRGNLKIVVINLGEDKYTIKIGDRVAQGKFSPVYTGYFIEKLGGLSSTVRGASGFGASGK